MMGGLLMSSHLHSFSEPIVLSCHHFCDLAEFTNHLLVRILSMNEKKYHESLSVNNTSFYLL